MLIKLGRRKPKAVHSVVRGAQLYLRLLIAAGVFASLFTNASADLPVACGGGACVPKGGPNQWVTYGSATPSISGNSMTIHQNSDRAILNWQSFNIGKENSVHFQQPTKDSVALNRVWDVNDNPSRILGALTANGEVWLINRNGIVFGEGAQVNVNSLVASTLDVSDSVFDRGLATALQQEDKQAAFVQSGAGVDANGNPVAITVGKDAQLVAQDGGRILLFAPAIENNGAIDTRNGQVVLAAGHKVWLEQGDNDLRGILVEVDQGGEVANLGDIIAKRGNATLVGLAINQSGRITATTASNVNGSIYLHARDTVSKESIGNGSTLEGTTTRTGSVEFGGDSVTSVIPDLDDTSLLTDDQPQPASQVDVMGKSIHLAGGAQVIVPGGAVNMTATVDPRAKQAPPHNNGSRVQMDAGSVIDVSGTTDSVASVSRNIIEVELRGLQLADAPLQRDGTLRNQQVKIDIRTVDENGNIPLANVKEAVQAVARGWRERFAVGGTVTLESEGDVVLNPGSVVDVSGGQVRYEGGMVETTRVISNGRLVEISEADPNAVYSGVYGSYERSYDKWGVTEKYNTTGPSNLAHYEAGYVEGKDAGTLQVVARGVVLNGEVRGEVTAGVHQRAPAKGTDSGSARPYDQAPLAGQLVVGDVNSNKDARTPDVLIQSGAQIPRAWGAADALPENLPLVLAPELFDHGVNRLKVHSNGTITIAKDTDLTLDAGGAVELVAGVDLLREVDPSRPSIDVQGRIAVASGTIKLETRATEGGVAQRGSIVLGESGALNVAGQWINDTPALNIAGAHDVAYTSGGKITLSSGGDVTLGTGSTLDVGGGAGLRDDGSLKAGRGGDITIESKYDGSAMIVLDGEIRGESLGKGGTFTLRAPSVLIASQLVTEAAPGQIVLAPEFFQSGGFNTYNIGAYREGLAVADGTQLVPRVQSYVLDSNYRLQTTGTDLRNFTTVQTLPDYQRVPVNLILASTRSDGTLGGDVGLVVGTGARIDVDPGAAVTLSSDRLLVVDGAITAPGGDIELKLSDNVKDPYLPDKAIWLGTNARLDASAYAQLQPNALGLRDGTMFDGGTIALTAERGFIVTEAGSELNVSGTAQTFDLQVGRGATSSFVPVSVAGDAGTIVLTASDGMLLDGDMRAHAAAVSGAAGGTLELTLRGDPFDNVSRPSDGLSAPEGTRAIELTQAQAPRVPDGTAPGDALLTADQIDRLRPNHDKSVESAAYLSQEQIAAGGFDALALSVTPVMGDIREKPGSNAMIRFTGDVDLSLRRSLTLDAAVIAGSGGNVNLSAPNVSLGQSNTKLQLNTPPQDGNGTLSVNADHVDLIGTLSLQGFGSPDQAVLHVHSNGDVRTLGVLLDGSTAKQLDGTLRAAGDVFIEAAQLYPSTLTHYAINVEGATDGTVRIDSTGTAQAPLSAAGTLEINAPHILQAGTVRAPFGTIALNGAQDVTLAPGSETSVSGAGLSVPFGEIQFGQDWILPFNSQNVGVVNGPGDQAYSVALPEKTVALQGPVIDMQPGAVVNVTGGGDLTAFEFIPGPGGSHDVLDTVDTRFAVGSFAVAPGLGGAYAPVDPLIDNAGIAAGTTVYLSGVDGLPAGNYAVLPARYALLPGAYLITPTADNGVVRPDANYTRLDNVPVTAGRYGVAGTDIHDSLWSAFAVENGEQVRRRSEYREVKADEFFTAKAQALGAISVPELPCDAGSLVVEAAERLNLSGQFKGESLEGRGGRVDVVGERVAVVNERTPDADRIELVATDLNQLGAQSLLIGGRRHVTQDGTELDISAATVEIEDGVQLNAPEVLLAAEKSASNTSTEAGSVHVGQGVSISADGPQQHATTDTLVLNGDTALVRVSSGEQADMVRQGVPAEGAARVTIDNGAQLTAQSLNANGQAVGGAIALDAAGDVLNKGALHVAEGGALHLGASRVSVGETDGRDIGKGIVLSNQEFAALDAGEVRLVSASTLDLYGAVDLTAQNLAIDSTGLRGLDNNGKSAVITATDTLQLTNSNGAATVDVGTGHGELRLAAREIRLGVVNDANDATNEIAVNGFNGVQLNASEHVVATGTGNFHASGDVTVRAGAVTAASAADWTVHADGALRAEKGATQQATDTVQSLGAKLRFEGASIDYRGDINLASGVATFSATGADGDVRVGGDAVIDVAGVTREFVDVTASSPGGRVELDAQHGDVIVESGTRIVVTGGQDADAGTLKVVAPEGQAQLDGSIRANAKPTTDANGNFLLDVANLADFSALNARLNDGGFGGERDVHVRNGDLIIASDDTVKAHTVTLTADGLDGTGNIEVLGTIDASGDAGGVIALNAARNVTLRDGSVLDAHATAENNDGGRVSVATTQGEIVFASGAAIDVRGTREVATYEQVLDVSGAPTQATNEFGELEVDANKLPVYQTQRVSTTDTGSVWFRAPRVNGDSDVAVTSLDGTVTGAGRVTVEAFNTPVQDADGSLSASELAAIKSESQQFMDAHAADITARLGKTTDARFHVIPGVEIRSAGDLHLNQELDLSTWRFGPRGEAGALTLRAGGDVDLNANLSDGANTVIDPVYNIEKQQVRKDDSWSYRIAAGADATSADPLAVTRDVGDVNIGSGVIVRSGTGDIDIAAGRDIRLQDNTTAIYTSGIDDGIGTLNPDIATLYLNASYAIGGGDVRIAAGRDIQAAPTAQLVNNWLARIGGPLDSNSGLVGDLPTAWAVNIGKFQQGVAALGGGDVAVSAGRDINDLSVSVITTGKQVGESEFDYNTGTSRVTSNEVVVSGGDRMDVTAGRDVKGGLYYLAQGEGAIHADSSITESDQPHPGTLTRFAPLVALGDARLDIRGGTGVKLETVFNPTILPQSNIQGLGDLSAPASTFSTYTSETAVAVTAVTGDVVLGEHQDSFRNLTFIANEANTTTTKDAVVALLNKNPATVDVLALEGNVRVHNTLDLYPDSRGQLELLAGKNVDLSGARVSMFDQDPASIPTPEHPGGAFTTLDMTRAPLHFGDTQPLRIYALNGYIGTQRGRGDISNIDVAKRVHLYAGGDIRNVDLTIQHANADDVSEIEALGDIVYLTTRDPSKGFVVGGITGIRVAGPGRLDVLAGGSIDLGTDDGIRTIGNRDKPFLPDQGADVTLMAGLQQQPDYEGFIQRYLVESRDYDVALQQFLADKTNDPTLSALDNFTRLPRETQREFIVQVFFSAIRKSTPGTDDNPADYSPGFNAIATLFPDIEAYHGDLSMLLSQVKTEDGGDINILVPGGQANIGVANVKGLAKSADKLGIVVAREGDINAFVNGDFLVNSSRVFALDGGNIVLWSSIGDIDAGKGSKTALSIPAPTVIYNTDAKPVAFEAPVAIAGSGIRQAVSTPGKEAGSVYLFAPKGKIDAGDAGIDIAGNLIVGATSVIGTDNIKVGGISVGVPVSDAGALAGTLSGVSNIASSVSKSAEETVASATSSSSSGATPMADSAMTFLEVEVLGYGDEEKK